MALFWLIFIALAIAHDWISFTSLDINQFYKNTVIWGNFWYRWQKKWLNLSNSLKISKNQQKITEVPHFDVLPVVYKNFLGVKSICNRENITSRRWYQKMKDIVGGGRAALKSALIFLNYGKIPRTTIFDFLRKSSRNKLLSISLKKTQKSCYKD